MRIIFSPTSLRPRDSNRRTISPTSPRCTPSGFTRQNVRSVASRLLRRLLLLRLRIEPVLQDLLSGGRVEERDVLVLRDLLELPLRVLLRVPGCQGGAERFGLGKLSESFVDRRRGTVPSQLAVDQRTRRGGDVLPLRHRDCVLPRRGHLFGLLDDDRLRARLLHRQPGGARLRLDRRARPPHGPRHAPEVQEVLLALRGAEEEHGPVPPDEHLARARLHVVPAERARAREGHAHLTLSLRASRAVSRSMRTSPSCTEPFTFRVMMRPLSRPSSTRTLTCTASPVIPVRPTTSTTSAGMPSSSPMVPSLLQGAELRHELVEHRLRLARVRDRHAGGRLAEAGGDAQLLLARDVRERDALLLAQDRHVHEDFWRVDVLRHRDKVRVPALDELRDLVRPLPQLPGVAGELDDLVRLVDEFLRHLEAHVDRFGHAVTSLGPNGPHQSRVWEGSEP